MNLYPLLVTWTLVNAGVLPDTECDGVIIDGQCHEKEILKTGLNLPYNLAVDYSFNVIYFSYYIDGTTYKSALFDLNTKEFKYINDVPNGSTQAVDQDTHDVYIGGQNGLYKYDHQNHKSESYAAKDKSISNVFIKDVLYFSELPSQSMSTYINGNIEEFEDLKDIRINVFVIDNEDIMFYSNYTGFYGQTKGGRDAVFYSIKFSRALTLDVHGNAYMCGDSAIYKINKMTMSLDKLVDVKNCMGLAFDKDNNFIVSDFNSLFRFKKIKTC